MATTIVTKKGSGAPAASDLVEGELAVDTTNGRLYTENSSAAVVELGSNPSGNITFGDNGKAIFGAGSDLQIYHNGTDSIIEDVGTGNLDIKTNGTYILLRNTDGNNLAYFETGGGSHLYWNGASGLGRKLQTTATGIDVTGSVTADKLITDSGVDAANFTSTGSTYVDINNGTVTGRLQTISSDFFIGTATVGTSLAFKSGNGVEAMRIDSSANILFGSTGQGYINGASTNTYNSGYNEDDDSWATWINYSGYQGGTTRYRDFIVGDGKNGRVATFDGSTGRVGIGVSLPSAAIHATTATAGYTAKFINTNGASDANGLLIQAGTVGSEYALNVANTAGTTNFMVVKGDGNVGIGTSSFNATYDPRLQVTSAASDGTGGVLIQNYLPTLTLEDISGGAAASQIQQDQTSMVFKNNGATRMTIDASGNLLVGTTASAMTAGGVRLKNGGGNLGEIALSNNSGSADYVARFLWGSTPTLVGNITVSSTATTYNTSSDYRLKENVVAMSGATERLKQLKPSRFNFIADADTTVDGFLAHEVADIVPEAITGTKDAVDADGNPEYQSIDQSKLVPLLVATIQELEARIAQLES